MEIFLPWVMSKRKDLKIKSLYNKIEREIKNYKTKHKYLDKIFSNLNIKFENLLENYLNNSRIGTLTQGPAIKTSSRTMHAVTMQMLDDLPTTNTRRANDPTAGDEQGKSPHRQTTAFWMDGRTLAMTSIGRVKKKSRRTGTYQVLRDSQELYQPTQGRIWVKLGVCLCRMRIYSIFRSSPTLCLFKTTVRQAKCPPKKKALVWKQLVLHAIHQERAFRVFF